MVNAKDKGVAWVKLSQQFNELDRAMANAARAIKVIRATLIHIDDDAPKVGALDRLRHEVSLKDIVGEFTALKLRGRKWVGLCPFHTEKTPSFTVDEEKELFHCFGCGIGGDVFSFVMERLKLDLPDAMAWVEARRMNKEAK